MTNSTADRLVDRYLTRLADAAQALSPERSTELLAEIREHIAAATSAGAGADEAAVRTMLDRLGDPADIVAAAVENDPPEHPSQPGPYQGRRPGIGLEVGAVVMLTAGSVIPIIGWVVGVILLWSSGIWRRSEKLLGTLIVPGGPGLALVGAPWAMSLPYRGLGITLALFALIGPVVVAIVLLRRARGRAELSSDAAVTPRVSAP